MDKYEFNIKVEQIKKLVSKSDYETAMKIADTIDWRRVRNTNLLSMVATIYEKKEDYEEAKEILLLAFERAPIGKRLLYKLADLALKEGNVDEAEAYYREFSELASDDPRQQLLRYMILKAKGAPAQQLIHSLESYTSQELDEKWLYELAELYSLAGQGDQCVETCDRIMLMFGLGKYVDKAMELKIQYAPLTTYQMDLVENRDKYEAKLRAVEQEYNVGDKSVNDQEPEEEYYEEQEPDMEILNQNFTGENLEARMQEVEVQENLAKEMSRISYEPQMQPEAYRPAQTRVLDDIRRVTSSMPRPHGGIYVPEPEPVDVISSEPIIEEDQSNETFWTEQEEPEEDFAQPEIETAATEDDYYMDIEELEDEDEVEDDPEEQKVQNHLMIEARTPERGLQMAIEALRQIHRETGVNNAAIKIMGSKLSKRGVLASAEKLFGKDLIIEEAGDLTAEALDELNELMNHDTSGMIVVLIDNPKQLETLHREHPILASKFECIGSGDWEQDVASEPVRQPLSRPELVKEATEPVQAQVRILHPESVIEQPDKPAKGSFWNRKPPVYEEMEQEEAIEDDLDEDEYYEQETKERESIGETKRHDDNGEEMDLDEFAQYACKYANEIDCSITGKSMLALYERIEIMEEDSIPLTRSNAEDLIEEAADHAEKPSFGKRLKGMFSSKYDKDGLLVLKEEHFI